MAYGFNDNKEKVNVPTSTEMTTALNGKQDKITGAASSIATSNLTANKALISNGNGKIAVSNISATELSKLSGQTKNIKTNFDEKQNVLKVLQKDVSASAPIAGDIYSVTVKFTAASDGYDGSKAFGLPSAFSDTNQIRIDSITRASNFSNTEVTYYVLFHGSQNNAAGTITFQILSE